MSGCIAVCGGAPAAERIKLTAGVRVNAATEDSLLGAWRLAFREPAAKHDWSKQPTSNARPGRLPGGQSGRAKQKWKKSSAASSGHNVRRLVAARALEA